MILAQITAVPIHTLPSGPTVLDILLWVLGISVAMLAFILLVVAPFAVRFTHRQSSTPDIVPREPGSVPAPADDFFNELGPRLADLGFAETQRWHIGGFATNVDVDICTMVDRRRRVAAIGNVVHVRRKGVFRLHSRFVEYSTRSADGRVILTTSTPTALLFTAIGEKRIYPLPSVLDPAVLLQAHEKLVARDFGSAALEEPARTAEFPDRVREVIADSHAWQIARGLLKATRGGANRLTLKGAFLYTWAAIPPGRFLVSRRIRAEEKRLLRELGIAVP